MYTPPDITLSPEHQIMVENNLRYIQELASLVQKTAACGVECQHYEALRQKLREVNQQLHDNFGSQHNHPI